MLGLKRNIMAALCMMVVLGGSLAYAGIYEPNISPELKKKRLTTRRLKDKDFYTRINIWFEVPSNFLSTNFHKGIMIPVGTKVKILRYGGIKIKFITENDGATYTLIHARKHSKIKLKELFHRYFSEESVMASGGAFSKLTRDAQENVKEGLLVEGMNKDATLMAYGYPPTHKTPDLTSSVWTYWKTRAEKVLVHFKDGAIASITE